MVTHEKSFTTALHAQTSYRHGVRVATAIRKKHAKNSYHMVCDHTLSKNGNNFIPPQVISYLRQSVSYLSDTNSYHMVCDHTLMLLHTKRIVLVFINNST